MIRRIGLAACALVLVAVTGAAAQQMVTGTVVRIDPSSNVVILDNGQMYQVTPQTVFLVGNQPAAFTAVQPGTPVAIQYAQPVAYQNGRYVVMAPASPGTVITSPAPGTVAALPPNGVYEVSGVVRYADANRGLLTFEDGRHVAVNENTQVLVGGTPQMVGTLRPGTFVVVRSSKPLAFRNGTYMVMSNPAPAAVVTSPVGPVTGTVVRVDQPNTIVLSDGRVIPATSQTVVMTDNRTVPVTALQPGSHVVIYPNGQAAVVSDQYPSALVGPMYPESGVREKENERNAP